MMHRKAIWCLSLLALATLIADASAQGRPRPTASRPPVSSGTRVPTASNRPVPVSQPRITSQPRPITSTGGQQSSAGSLKTTPVLPRQPGLSTLKQPNTTTTPKLTSGNKPGLSGLKQPNTTTSQKVGQAALKKPITTTSQKQGLSALHKQGQSALKPQGKKTSPPSGELSLTDPRGSSARPLSQKTNEFLGTAEKKVSPKGKEAIEAVQEGRLMKQSEVEALRKELKTNPALSAPEKAGIAAALQKDMEEKRELLAAKRPNINVVLGGGGLGGGGVLGGGGDSGDATIVQPTVVVPSVVQPTVVEPMIVTEGGGSTGTGGSSEPEVTLHYNRMLKVRNSTDEKLTVYVLIAVSDGSSETWSSGSPEKATEALVYELEAGQETYLSGDDGALAGSRIRIWADSENGLKWAKFKTQDCVLAANAYEASEMQTYTHNFTK